MTAARRGADSGEDSPGGVMQVLRGQRRRPEPIQQAVRVLEPISPSGNMVPTAIAPGGPAAPVARAHRRCPVAVRSSCHRHQGAYSRAITHTEFEGTNRTAFGKDERTRLTFANDVNTVAKRVDHINSARVMENKLQRPTDDGHGQRLPLRLDAVCAQ